MEIFSKAFMATLEEEWYSLTGSCSSPLALLLGLPRMPEFFDLRKRAYWSLQRMRAANSRLRSLSRVFSKLMYCFQVLKFRVLNLEYTKVFTLVNTW